MLFRSLYDGEQSFHERKKVQEPTPFLDFFTGAGERTRTADRWLFVSVSTSLQFGILRYGNYISLTIFQISKA